MIWCFLINVYLLVKLYGHFRSTASSAYFVSLIVRVICLYVKVVSQPVLKKETTNVQIKGKIMKKQMNPAFTGF